MGRGLKKISYTKNQRTITIAYSNKFIFLCVFTFIHSYFIWQESRELVILQDKCIVRKVQLLREFLKL